MVCPDCGGRLERMKSGYKRGGRGVKHICPNPDCPVITVVTQGGQGGRSNARIIRVERECYAHFLRMRETAVAKALSV